MPQRIIEKFQIEYMQLLDENAKCDEGNSPHLTQAELIQMYQDMVLTRHFDAKLLALQRQGKIGTFAQCVGQEATQVGSAHALAKKDWIVPAFREIAVAIVRGVPLENLIMFNGGREEGSVVPEGTNIFPTSIPVGTHPLHAVGFAWGKQLQKEKVVVATYFGDGATSEGDFHEACNFASVMQAPVVFICQNNQFAISTPVTKQTHAQTLAQKALAYNMPTIQVDGNDILAVYKATAQAVERARKGGGPSFIECLTYRLADHTTADDARKYRPQEEVEAQKKKDPILRLKKFLESKKIWDAQKEEQMLNQIGEQIKKAVAAFENLPRADPKDMFRFTYKEQTKELEEQQQQMQESLKSMQEADIWYL